MEHSYVKGVSTRDNYDETKNVYYNEIEKKKAIESKEYPHPYYIRRCLGDALGDVVVGLIPKEICERLKSESNGGVAPNKFEMKTENLLRNDLKLTPVDEFPDTTSYMETILCVGKCVKIQTRVKVEEEHNEKVRQWVEDTIARIADFKESEWLKAVAEEDYKFQSKTDLITEKYDRLLAEVRESLEKPTKEMHKTFSRLTSKIERDTLRAARIARKNREKNLRCEFEYHMELARAKMFEEFHEKKRKLELDWCKRLEAEKENHCKAIEWLKESMELEHMKNIAELEVQHRVQNAEISEQLSSLTSLKPEKFDENSSFNVIQIGQDLDNALLEKEKDLFVYKKRLNHVLNGYVDFVKNALWKYPESRKKRLARAKLLMTKVNRIETGNMPDVLQAIAANSIKETLTGCRHGNKTNTTYLTRSKIND